MDSQHRQRRKIRLPASLLKAAGVCVIVIALTGMAMMASYLYLDESDRQKMQAQRDMRQWQSKISKAIENRKIIERFEADFQRLVEKGVVGDEPRLSWFETIKVTAEQRGMPLVKYGIGPQQALQNEHLEQQYPGLAVYKSVMTMDMTLGHEGDLFALLNRLAMTDGLFAVDRCDIKRLEASAGSGTENLSAYCELGWYTFRSARQGVTDEVASTGSRR